VRIESSVISVSWIPREAIEGVVKLPFELGVAHYDLPPPDRLDDLEGLLGSSAIRFANELRAFVELDDDGRVTGHGHLGRGHMGHTRMRLAGIGLTFCGISFPDLRGEPEVGEGLVRFTQTAGGQPGMPSPRRVRRRPYLQVSGPVVWSTLALTIRADGTAGFEVVGASSFPRHWIYGRDGTLQAKTGLVEQGQAGDELYLLFDGVLAVEQDGRQVAEVGPGAILGEMALLEGGRRTATLRAVTRCRVAVVPGDRVDRAALAEVARRRRDSG
jgi:hypothetical protein